MLNLTYQEFKFNKITLSADSTSTSEEEHDDRFEIDVQPKRKYFETVQEKRLFIEEYTKKKKTELCKNYELSGYCKFGEECSFAHGYEELVPKTHLHQKYKTKPCNRYFSEGFCPYGIRCQYMHDELKNLQKYDKYLIESYKSFGMKPPISNKQLNSQERFDIQRFQIVLKRFQNQGFNPEIHSRAKFFKQLELKNQI